MLYLDNCELVGRGLHRECYAHPVNSDLCVKVVVAGNSDENRREAAYYQRLSRRGISWEMLTRFHGLVQTSLGEGAVFDLVRDGDGSVSKTLASYLKCDAITCHHREMLAQAMRNLKEYLLLNRVVTMTLKPKNILLQLDPAGDGKLVIVDNVANSDFIPITNYSARLARRKIERKWRRFENSLRREYAHNEVLLDVLVGE